MKEKVVEICIRVSENEKKKLQRNAKKSGLSLSAYLRKTGLKQEIYSIPDKEFYKIYNQISELRNEFDNYNYNEIMEKLEQIQSNFLDIYNSEKVGGNDGYN